MSDMTGSTNPVDLVWLASYPRTGSNWVRTILAHIMTPKRHPRWLIPSFKGYVPFEMPVFLYQRERRLAVAKTHLLPDTQRTNCLPAECAGVITVHRHPLDVMLSMLNFARVRKHRDAFLDGEIHSVEDLVASGEIERYIDAFCTNDGIAFFSSMCGGLSEYQRKWDEFAKGKPHLRICYEHMVADPGHHVAAIHEFFGIDYTPERIQEVGQAAQEKTATSGATWKKQAFHFEQLIPAATARRFCEHYRPMLQYLGYAMPGASFEETGGRDFAPTRRTGKVELGWFKRLPETVSLGSVSNRPLELQDPAVAALMAQYRDLARAKEYSKALTLLLTVVGQPGIQAGSQLESSIRLELGDAYLHAGQVDAGANEYRAVLAREPGNFRAHYKLGIALSRLNRKEEAVGSFRRSLELSGDPESKAQIQQRLAVAEREARASAGDR
jgi:hypothetical protein